MTDLYKYTVCKPRGGDALVKSSRQEIYYLPGEEALYAAVDTYLIETAWVSRMSCRNDTDATQTYSHSCSTGLRITNGSEVNNGFSLKHKYDGTSVTIEHQQRVFKTTETTEAKTITITLSVPPRSLLVFYQRRYRFRDTMSFVLDAWGQDWNVGSWGGNGLLMKTCEVEIMGEDYLTVTAELDGTRTGTIDVQTVDRVSLADNTRRRENCPTRCKDKLDAMRV
ncbi:hypothetical protein BJV74DRAFT_65440 [Russula compacta]|nr:hypothetical protein BJV74DRAFT_65440 [Russula compacta]